MSILIDTRLKLREFVPLFSLAWIASFSVSSSNAAEIIVADELSPAYQQSQEEEIIVLEQLTANTHNDVEPLLYNGTPVNPKDFPAVFRMVTSGTCTATVIGPESMLVAAHCLKHKATIRFTTGDRTVTGICHHSPGYASSVDNSEDFALCILSHQISGFPYEAVDVTIPGAVNDRVFLTGYGCTQKNGDIDGLLRIGVSTIVNKPVAEWKDAPATIYSKSDEDFGEAVLCPGDSGGPLYRLKNDIDGERRIIGVNSGTTHFPFGVSLFAATASAPGIRFFEAMINTYGLRICGINLNFNCAG